MTKADKEGQRKAPILRFKGFTDDWEQRKLGNLFNERKEKSTKGELLSVTLSNGVTKFSDLNKKDNSNIKSGNYKVVKKNDIPYNSMRMWQGASGVSSYDGIVSPAYTVLVPNRNSNSNFYAVLFKKKSILNLFTRFSQGLTSDTWNLKYPILKDIIVPFTNLEEQKRIFKIFNVINNLLALYERKLKLLSQVKKYFLDNLFTEKEYPNLRFKGFTDAWEQRKLGQVGKTQSGVGFPNEEQGGLEGIPFFKVSDMNNPGNEYEMVNANNYVKDDQLARKKWHPIKSVPAVIFAKVGAAIMLNRKRLVTRPFLIDNNSMAYIFDDSWDINFGKNIFETINLPRYAQVGALPSYNGSDIQGIKIFLPRKNEQSKIGIFIMTINEIITLYENKQQHLTKIKKTLLNTMFI